MYIYIYGQPYRPPRPVTGIALLYFFYFKYSVEPRFGNGIRCGEPSCAFDKSAYTTAEREGLRYIRRYSEEGLP
jgi:hypothetical protein